MNFFLAQAVPSFWLLPFLFLYALGIPFGAFLALNANLLVSYLPKTPFVALVWTAILIPAFGLAPMELFRFVGNAREGTTYRAMTLASVLLSLLALYRRARIKPNDSPEPPSRA